MNNSGKALRDKIQLLEAEIEKMKFRQSISPNDLEQGENQNSILVNGIKLYWDTVAGTCTFGNLPVAMLWIDTTMAGLMSGLAAMVGTERFSLALQSEGRNSVESDWLMISKYADFREGFNALNHTASVAGWGDWQLIGYFPKQKKCVFRIFNNWEGLYQAKLGVCWGSGLIAGKLSGICTKLFKTNCWATQTSFIANGNAFDEFIVVPSSRSIEEEVEKLLISDKATRADMAVALEKLRGTEKSLRNSENKLLKINEELEGHIAERTKAFRLSQFTIEHTNESVFWFSASWKILDVNEAACRLLGYSREELLTLTIDDIHSASLALKFSELWQQIQQQGKIYFESQLYRKSGDQVFVEITANYLKFEDREYNCAFVRDITQRKKNEDKIRELAYYDTLTNLPNRRMLFDRINNTLAMLSRGDYYGAILYIDLDNFKTLNDSLGHDFGDLLLIEVSQRLLKCTRSEDTVSRLGGDEFVIVLNKLDEDMEKSAHQVTKVALKIISSINRPFKMANHVCYSSPSIGIKLFQSGDNSVVELLKHADTAMYESKRSGRNTLRFFNTDMQKAIDDRVNLENALRTGLVEDQFELFFQAQNDNANGFVGAEVLLRWDKPGIGYILPETFIPIAEENGLIVLIGNWVLESACKQLKLWESDPLTKHLYLAVNVSHHQFNHPDFINTVKDILEKSQINPTKLKMELTESVFSNDLEQTIQKMEVLKSFGISFAIDDFGTGYSALASLKQLPINQLKIDQSFIHNLGVDVNSEIIVKTIIAMATSLGLEVIAEGVETDQQLIFLNKNDCHTFQGYFFAHPLPLTEFIKKVTI